MENKNQIITSSKEGKGIHAPPPYVFEDIGSLEDASPGSVIPPVAQVPQGLQEQPSSPRHRGKFFLPLLSIVLLITVVSGFAFYFLQRSQQTSLTSREAISRFGNIELPLSDLISDKDLSLSDANITINGALQVSDSLLLVPSLQPTGAKRGQIYFDQTTNQLAYYNGSTFVFLSNAPVSGIQSLGGATGELTLGDGLVLTANQLESSGVLSVQGQTGDVILSAGPGLVINGTNFSNSGVLSIAAGTPNVTVGVVDGAVTISVETPAQGTGTVTSSGGTAGKVPVYTGAQNIEDSIITQAGLAVSVGGDLQVTGDVSFSNALTVAQGGTGATTLTGNGVLVGNGTTAISSIAAGGPSLCLLSTAGAPVWGTCPGSGGVTSLNGLTGVLNIANTSAAGSTITIDNASTTNKGIASFNATNFSVSGGAVNTIQDIANSASPTFAGVNTNNINPSAALGVGAASQTLTLQGNAATTLTANGGVNSTTVSFQSPTANTTYRFLTTGGGTFDICTTQGNCTGTGGGVTTAGGTINRLAKFTAGQAINDSSMSDDGTNVLTSIDMVIQGGDITVGVPTTQTGTINLANSGSAFLGSIVQGALSANRTYTLPDISGTICLTSGSCASGVNSLNGLIGALNIANASAAGTTITIDNASTSSKGIASFNATNFSASGGAINTIQNINTTATPTFAGVITNDITPTGALTIGTDSQTTLLRGSITTITSSGAGNDIILNAADTIELQSDTNVTGDVDVSGTLTTGTVNALQVAASGDITINGIATVSGGTVTVGSASQAGSLILHDGSSNTGTLNTAALGQNTVYILPDPGAPSATICLTSGNCAGTGGGVTTSGGTLNRLAKFSASQAVADSSITDTGTTVTTSADMIIQGGDVTVGIASSQTGTINLAHSGSAFLGSILQGALTANRTYTLPDVSGIVCLSSGNCAGSGSANTLQAAYDAGNTITTSDSRDLALTLANTTVDANFTVEVATGGTGYVAFRRADGAGTADPVQLLLLDNLDADRVQPTGLRIQAAGGGMTTALDATDPEIVTALSVAANDIIGTTGNITYTNFNIAGATGTITTAGDIAVNGGDITSSGTLSITPGGTLTVGATGQQLTLQGNASTRLTATGGGFTTGVGFAGTPVGDVTYNFDRSITAGTYQICTTIGNCAGAGAGVTSAGGTIGTLAKFTGSQAIGDSLLSESGSTVTVNGNLNLISGNQFRINGTQISSANLSNDANLAKLNASQTFTGNTVAFQNGANSTNAFNVQNQTGGRVLTVDTSGAQVVLGQGSLLNGAVVFHNASNANTITLVGTTATGARTVTLPDATGTVCLQGAAACGFVAGTASNFIANDTNVQSGANFNISGTGIAGTFQSATYTSSGALSLDSATTSALNIGTGANAKTITLGNATGATAVAINTGTGGISVGTNAVNKTITIGASGSTANTTTVNIANSTGADQTVSIGSTNGASATTIRGGTEDVDVVTSDAFRVLNVGIVTQFSVDTSASRVYIGNPTGDTTGALLVLDTKTDAGDPTGADGGMYYNSNSGKFRCYEAGSWRNCITYPLINRYYLNSSQNLTNVTDTKVQFQATHFSEGSSVTVTGNDTFTLNKAGIWQLTTSVWMSGNANGGERYIAIVDSDNPQTVRYTIQNSEYGATTSAPALSTATTMRFPAGTKLSVLAYQASGTTLQIQSGWSFGTNFTLTWIGD